jgi:hypothetical protein
MSKESTAALRDRLDKMGIQTHDNEVWTSIGAVNALLRAKGLTRCVSSGAYAVAWDGFKVGQAIHFGF